jgi:outer membrane protein OmpA-like peptidoglycan-associated protein
MRKAGLLVPLLAFALSACGGGPRPIYEPPPMPPEHAPRETPRAPSAHPTQHPAQLGTVPVPQALAGPLTVAKLEPYMDALEMDVRRHVHARGIVTARQGNLINIVIQNDLLFTADGGVAGDNVLEPLAAVLRGYVRVAVAVSGYTDTAGPTDKNLAVSQNRARLIAGALIHEGVAASRVSAEGFGEAHLRVRTGDDKAEPRNRRIEILLRPVPG